MFINFLAAIIFYLFPVLIGLPFSKRLIPSFFLGCLIIYLTYITVFLVFSLFGVEQNFSFYSANILRLWVILSLLYNAKFLFKTSINLINLIKDNLKVFLGYTLTFIALLSVYLFAWRASTPYPLILNWDFFEHLTVINLISVGEFSLLGTRLTDTFTFNSYTTLFHILLTLPISILKTDLPGVYWWLEMLHYLFSIGIATALAKKLSNKNEVAIITAVITGLVFESSVIYRSFFLIPQTFTAFLALSLLYEVIEQKVVVHPINQLFKNKNTIFILIGLLVLLLMHFIIGPIAILMILSWILISSYPVIFNLLLNITIVALIFSLLLNFLPGIDLTRREEASHLMITPLEKARYFLNWYGFLLPVLIGVSIFIFKKTENFGQKLILLVGLNLMSLSLLPIAYFLKFYVLASYFINISLAFGLYYLSASLHSVLRALAYVWILAALLVVFYLNQLAFKTPFYFEGNHSHVSQSEIDAAYWLRTNFDRKTTLLISDPGSQYVFESLSLINTQGGAYMDISTRQKLVAINWSDDVELIRQNLLSVEDMIEEQKVQKRLFIIGGRYFAWQRLPENEKLSVYFNIWRPHKIGAYDYSYINFLTNNFKVLYQNDEMIILEI